MEEFRHKITQTEIAWVFADWIERYQEDPDPARWKPTLDDEPQDYGEACAEFFLEILDDIRLTSGYPQAAGHD